MKKKHFFKENIQLKSIEFKILIDHGKIREFEGFHLLQAMLVGGRVEIKTFYLNSDFELVKVTKYDQYKLKLKANFQIKSHELDSYLAQDVFIKLNFFEKLKIDYAKNEDVFHKMNLTQRLLILILITIPGAILIALITNKCDRLKLNDNRDKTQIEKHIK